MNLKALKLILLFITLSVTSKAFCQKSLEKSTTKKNAISIEFYQPIDNLLKPFFDFESLFGNDYSVNNNDKRSSFSSAFGISYERIKNDVVFRPRLGISITNNSEKKNYTSINIAEDYRTDVNQKDNYTQNHINLFVGVAKRIHVNNKFSIDCGFDLASIFYLKGKGDYDYSLQRTKISDNSWISNQTINVNDRIGPITSLGIGPLFKPQYTICKNVVVSMEFQVYFMKTFSSGISTREEMSDTNSFPDNHEHIELSGEINYHINQWNWTKVSPLVRIGYEF